MGEAEAASDAARAPWLRRFPAALVRAVLRLVWGLKVSGLENVPKSGPVIVAGNHVSLLDGPLLAAALLEARYVRFLGKVELFRIPILGWYLRKAGALPLDRRGDVAAMRSAVAILADGGCFGLFPEGTRSKTGRLGRGKAGIGFLAGRTGAVVVPARLVNTDKFPRLAALEVRLGPGLRFEGDPSDRTACQAFADAVMGRILALSSGA